jgi:type IV pilus assembly protein PilC
MTIGQARHAIADAKARAEFYRMWHAGQRMGATHPHILDTMGARTESREVESLRALLLEGTRRRETLATILQAHPGAFHPLEKALLVAGEEAGTLEQALNALATHYRAEHRLLLKVWSKLTYPLITSFLAFFIAPLPLLVIGNTSGYITSATIGVAGWYSFGGAVVVALAGRYASRREFVLARLARMLAMGVEAGLPLDRVATLAADAAGDRDMSAHVGRMSAQQIATQPLSTTFIGCTIIPPEMRAAMTVAEVSGDFSGALRKLADLYDDR